MNNPKFIGKFNEKYLDLFSIVEINKMFNSKILDEDSYSTLFNKLFNYDPKKLLENFNEDTLKNCSKHSISVYLFDYINEDLRNKMEKLEVDLKNSYETGYKKGYKKGNKIGSVNGYNTALQKFRMNKIGKQKAISMPIVFLAGAATASKVLNSQNQEPLFLTENSI